MARATHLFTISPGAPFLATFVEALLAGGVISGFPAAGDPAALSAATIFVPTRRAAAALAQELARALQNPVVLLPRIVPLGRLEDIETSLAFHDAGFDESFVDDLPDFVSDIERRLALARLILHWAQALRYAIISIDSGGARKLIVEEPQLVAASPTQAWHLSSDLAGLIDDMTIEGVDWSALEKLAPEDYDTYWRITLEFLKIAVEQWPAYLTERNLIDAADRQKRLVDLEISRLDSAPSHAPVIAIGSTGANPATARLLGAVARLRLGAVVLPGVDMSLDANAWSLISGGQARGLDPADGHPQAMLHRLLNRLAATRDDVVELGQASTSLLARARFVSESMRPAEATDAWFEIARALGASFTPALADVTLIEATDEREEALCLAIAARRALERQDATIAIVTPDRALARRVKGELARWNIEVDDSAGDALALSPPGVLARLVLTAAAKGSGAVEALALLSHPLTRLDYEEAELARLCGLVEIAIWRAVPTGVADNGAIIDAARLHASERDAHPAVRAIGEGDWAAMRVLLDRLDVSLAPLRQLPSPAPHAAWVKAHRDALARVLAPVTPDEANEAILEVFETLVAPPSLSIDLAAEDYAGLIEAIFIETIVRSPSRAHPRLKILGPLEARLLHADVMLLGGLDETIWPPQARNDPFLNRPMRAALGLGPPERRIGQTAHDFTQLLGAPKVIISRARKRGGSPTNPSRFLQRMAALAGAETWTLCRKRGEELLGLARRIDYAKPVRRPRPEPRPPLNLRPMKLSVTRIETFRRDPYSIYAEFILRLMPLQSLGVKPDARETGNLLHALMAEFTQAFPTGAIPDDSLARLEMIARTKFSARFEDPDFRLFLWPRIANGLAGIVEWENARRADIARIDVEQYGKLPLILTDGSVFELSAQADRIERRKDGSLIAVDFKTGAPPSQKVVAAGFAPQLTLEAAMIELGAFEKISPAHVVEGEYVRILNGVKCQLLSKSVKDRSFRDLAAEHLEQLRNLLDQFRSAETPYLPRPYPQFIAKYSSYDHLARVKEWAAGVESGET